MIETRTSRVVQELAISCTPPPTTTKEAIHAEVTQFFHQLNLSDTMKGRDGEDGTRCRSTESSSIVVRWMVLNCTLSCLILQLLLFGVGELLDKFDGAISAVMSFSVVPPLFAVQE